MGNWDYDTVTAHPLVWPDGFARTSPGARHSSWKFKRTSMAKAIASILDELRKMAIDEDDIVISSNIPVKLNGLPYASRGPTSSDPGVAVYWIDEDGEKMSMACDHYDTLLGNFRGIALTIKALRDIARHGGSDLMKRSFQGFKALPAAIPIGPPWYEVLGFTSPPGDFSEVSAAYRSRIEKIHPDRMDGEESPARALNVARDEAEAYFGRRGKA